jgi:hypothetical protein
MLGNLLYFVGAVLLLLGVLNLIGVLVFGTLGGVACWSWGSSSSWPRTSSSVRAPTPAVVVAVSDLRSSKSALDLRVGG